MAFYDRKSKERGIGLPRSSLRTGLANLFHPALQSVVCSFGETGDFRRLGFHQVIEPQLGKWRGFANCSARSPISEPDAMSGARWYRWSITVANGWRS